MNIASSVSHDVDRPLCTAGRSPAGSPGASPPMSSGAGTSAWPRDGCARMCAPRVATSRGIPDTFDFMMTESERRGWRSAFYFMAGRGEPGIDADYDLGAPWIRRLIRRIGGRQHEIGIHPSYRT